MTTAATAIRRALAIGGLLVTVGQARRTDDGRYVP